MGYIYVRPSEPEPNIISFWYNEDLGRVVPYDLNRGAIMSATEAEDLALRLLDAVEDLTDAQIFEADRLENEREAVRVEQIHEKSRLMAESIAQKPPIDRGFVYLIHAEGTSRYKIGKTENIKARLKSLKSKSPYPLSVIKAIPSNRITELESWLHGYFADYRVNGEWFELSNEAIAEFMSYEEVA